MVPRAVRYISINRPGGPIEDLSSSIFDTNKSAIFQQSCFKTTEEGFCKGIVIRVIRPAHTG